MREKIELRIEADFGFGVTVVLRTAAEMDLIINNCPFSAEEIKEAEEAIQTNRELLLMMSMANPKDLIEEDEDALYATRNRVNDLINDLLEQCDKLTLLRLYFSAIEDGTAKFTDNETN